MNNDPKNDKFLHFYSSIYKLKKLVRRGWELRGIDNPESVADHSFGVAMLAMILGLKMGRDVGRCVMLALVHDIGEAIIGDITPSDGVSASQKSKAEHEAAEKIFHEIDKDGYLLGLWKEVETASSEDARFIKELDKLEMAFQAYHYERERGDQLDDFFSYASERINSDEIRPILRSLIENRQTDST